MIVKKECWFDEDFGLGTQRFYQDVYIFDNDDKKDIIEQILQDYRNFDDMNENRWFELFEIYADYPRFSDLDEHIEEVKIDDFWFAVEKFEDGLMVHDLFIKKQEFDDYSKKQFKNEA